MNKIKSYLATSPLAAMLLVLGLVGAAALTPITSSNVSAQSNGGDWNLNKAIPGNGQESDVATGEGQPTSLFGDGGIFTTIINVLLFLAGIASVIMLIIGGFRYTMSNGDQNAVTSAKNTIMYSIIGLVVSILAYAIVNWVVGALQQQ